MSDSPDKPRQLRTFADDIEKRDRWLKKWLLVFSGLAAINVIMVIAARLTRPPPHNQPASIYMVLCAALAVYFALQRHQLKKLKAKHSDSVIVYDTPDIIYTNYLIMDTVRQGVSPRVVSVDHPLLPIASGGGASIQPVSLQEVVRRLKLMCNHKPRNTAPEFFKIVNHGMPDSTGIPSRYRIECTFRDESDDFASLTFSHDPDE